MVEHAYVDGTFVTVPAGYKQMLVISIRDPNTDQVFPALFGLINTKEEDNYYLFLNSVKSIITEHGSFDWGLKNVTLDFEEGLQEAFSRVFNTTNIVGCLFHYRQALFRQAQSRRLTTQAKMDQIQRLMDKLSSLCWSANHNIFRQQLDKIKDEYKDNNEFTDYIKYFDKYWHPKFISGQINYSDKEDVYRSNSVLESYNRRIKDNLPRMPSWPKFYEFVKQEERRCFDELILAEKKGRTKKKSTKSGKGFKPLATKKRKRALSKPQGSKKHTPIKDKNDQQTQELSDLKPSEKKDKKTKTSSLTFVPWINWKNNSCRYDSFITLFVFGLLNKFPDQFNAKQLSGRETATTDYRKLTSLTQELKKGKFEAVEDYWTWRAWKKLDDDDVGDEGPITSVITSLRALPVFASNYQERLVCHNSKCPAYQIHNYVEKCWRLPFILTTNNYDVCTSYAHEVGPKYIQCMDCKQMMKEVVVPSDAEPEFLVLMVDSIQTHMDQFQPNMRINRIFQSVLSRKSFILLGCINVPYRGHFNCFLTDPVLFNGDRLLGDWMHDGIKNQGNIIRYPDYQDISVLNPYILFYKRL